MSGASTANLEGLIGAIRREKELFELFLNLTQEQAGILAAEDVKMESLAINLNERRKLMVQIDGLHQELDLLMQSYIPINEKLSGKEQELVRALQTDIDRIAGEIRDLDRKNMQRAKQALGQVGEEIQKSKLNRKTFGAYHQLDLSAEAGYFDKKQ